MRSLILSIVMLLVASPAFAQSGVYDLTKVTVIATDDSDCVDLYDEPATTSGVDLTTTSNWDTQAEAVNPGLNVRDAVQTSGSPDGWCDSAPWIIDATGIVLAGDEDLYIGPVLWPSQGAYVNFQVGTITGTNIALRWMIDSPYGYTPFGPLPTDTLFSGTTITTASQLLYYVGPDAEGSSQVTGMDYGPIPTGGLYLRIDMNGAGTFAFDLGVDPARKR